MCSYYNVDRVVRICVRFLGGPAVDRSRWCILSAVVIFALILCTCRSVVTAQCENKPEKKKSERWAVLIGVDDYAYAKDLQFCGADMKALQAELVKAGFDERQTVLLSDEAKEKRLQPYKTNIQKQIELTCANAERGDLVLIAFSGHGVHFDKVSYLCPTDAKLDSNETLISLDWVYQQLQKCEADLKLVMVDACRNVPPELSDKRSFTTAERKDGTRAFVQEAERLPEGIVLLNSCSEGEFAQEDKDFGHGVFMHFLLEGIQGKADGDGDQSVTLNELFRFASKETKLHVSTKFADSQRPKLKGNLTIEALDFEVASLSVPERPNQVKPLPSGTPKTMTNSIGMKVALIPAGEFLMGSSEENLTQAEQLVPGFKREAADDEQPQRRVQITRPFYLGVHEVTLGQFLKFYHDAGYKVDAEKDGKGGWGYDPNNKELPFGQKKQYVPWDWGFAGQTPEHPVVNVSWNDATAFCEWLSRKEGQTYRLPTEAEWEYACKAGTTTVYQSGDDPETLAKVGNIADGTAKAKFSSWSDTISARDGYVFTAPVGRFSANAFGLYDMHGNAYEWCSDWYDGKYYGSAR